MKRLIVCLILLAVISLAAWPANGQGTLSEVSELYDSGEYQKAVEICRKMLEVQPGRIDILYFEVKAALYSPQALEYIQHAVDNKDGGYLDQFRFFLVEYYTGRHKPAAAQINRLAETYPDRAWVKYWQGNAAYILGEDSVAIEFYTEASKDSVVHPTAIKTIAFAYEMLGNLAAADSLYASVENDAEVGVDAVSSRCEIIGLQGNWTSALEKYAELAARSNAASVYLDWSTQLDKLGRYDRAIPVLEEALQKWPNNKKVRANLSGLYRRSGDYEKAMEVIEGFTPLQLSMTYCATKAIHALVINDTLDIEQRLWELIESNPDYTYPSRRLVQWLEDRGRLAELDSLINFLTAVAGPESVARTLCALAERENPDRALEIRDSLIASKSRFDWSLIDRIEWLKKVGRQDEADQEIERLVGSRPGDYSILVAIASLEAQAMDYTAALDWLDRADKLSPHGVMVLDTRIDVALDRGDKALALALLDSVTTMYPYRADLLYSYRDCYDEKDDRDAILDLADRFADYCGTYPFHAKQLAMLYGKLKEYEKADSVIAASLAEYPTSAELYYYRGFIAEWRGDFDLSRESFERAVAMDPYEERYSLARGGSTDEGVTLETYTHRSKPDTTGLVRISADSILSIAANSTLPQGEYSDGAIILLDKTQQIISSEYRRLRRVHRVVKAVTASGAESYGSISFGFDAWDETPRLLEARVINPDGSVQEVEPGQVFVNSQGTEYSDNRYVTLNFPGADSGDVFEAMVQFEESYKEASDLYRNYFFDEWNPVVQSIVELRVPTAWPIVQRHTSKVEFSKRDSSGTAIYTWTCTNLPALNWESSCPSVWERGESLHFGYKKSWQEVAEKYWRQIAGKFEPSDSLLALTADLTKGLDTEEEKLAAIYDFVARKIRYVAIEFGDGAIVPRQAGAILTNAYGDCKDKTTLLLSMLKAVGITGYPALVTGADTLSIPAEIPSVRHFTHMIAYLPQFGDRFVDPTCTDCDLFQVWRRYEDQPCLIIGSPLENPYVRVTSHYDGTSRYRRSVFITPREKGGLDLDVDIEMTGETAMRTKLDYRHEDTSVIRAFTDSHAGVGITSVAKFQGFSLHDSTWSYGPEFSFSAKMSVDSTFLPEVTPAAYYIWFYTLDNYLDKPDTTQRELDYVLDEPFLVEDRFVLDLSGRWELDAYLASWVVDTTWFRASADYDEYGDSMVVQLSFEPKMLRIPAADVPDFARAIDWIQRRVRRQVLQCRRAYDTERVATLKTALEESPNDASLTMALVQTYLSNDIGGSRCEARERRDKARELLAAILRGGEANDFIAASLASLLTADGRFAEADSVLRAYEENQPLTALSASLMSVISYALGNYEDAEQRLQFVMKQVPGDELRQVLVEIYARQGRFEDAWKQIKLLESLNAEPTIVAQAKYTYYLQIDSLGEAEAVIDNWPDTGRIVQLVMKGEIREREGDYATALSESLELMQENPDSGPVLNNVAWNLAHLDSNLTYALQLANRSLALTGMCDGGVRNTRGYVYLRMGEFERAREDFTAAMSNQDARSRSINFFYLGECELADGNRDEAKEYYAKSLECGVHPFYIKEAQARLAELE